MCNKKNENTQQEMQGAKKLKNSPSILTKTVKKLKSVFPNIDENIIWAFLIVIVVQMFSSKQVRFDESGKINLLNWYALIFVQSGGGKDRLVQYMKKFIFKKFTEWHKVQVDEIYEIQMKQYEKALEENKKTKNASDVISKENIKQHLKLVKGELKNGKSNPF